MRDKGSVFLDALPSGLQSRIVVAPFSAKTAAWQIVYLHSGTIEVSDLPAESTGGGLRLSGNSLICQSTAANSQIRLSAGSSGVHLALSESALAAALGGNPEALEIRIMLRNALSLALEEFPERNAQILHCFNAIAWEMDRPAPGQQTMIEAQIRCLLVHLWRFSDSDEPRPVATGSERMDGTARTVRTGQQEILLRRFRQLVETYFRTRWRVSDYADRLGISADRLHNTTTTRLGRTPLQLLHERSEREAHALLTRSNLTLDQIAAELGFGSAAQFSAFFKKRSGLPPGRYRAQMDRDRVSSARLAEPSFTAWP
ncbi:MAG: helix-turn-helix domain-containing protein [Pseudomonadota bacterium]